MKVIIFLTLAAIVFSTPTSMSAAQAATAWLGVGQVTNGAALNRPARNEAPPGVSRMTHSKGEALITPANGPTGATAFTQAIKSGASKGSADSTSSWWSHARRLLSKVSRTAWCCAAVFLWLFYALLVRVYTVRALVKGLHNDEEQLAARGISGDLPVVHPAVLAIRKWSQFPATKTERVYRWMDGDIAAVFGSLISRGEFLRTACLNISFGATILAFVLATSGGHDIDRMLAEVSGALGATLVGLVFFTIESSTLARLNGEAVRLEFEGRELIDIWATDRCANKLSAQATNEIDSTAEDESHAFAS